LQNLALDRRQYVSALIVPAFEALKAWAQEKRIVFRDHEDLIARPEVVQLMEERIRSRSLQLAPFETIRKFTLLARQFTQQAGEITPTLKVRRKGQRGEVFVKMRGPLVELWVCWSSLS
jgi:long-chain acyl-CoA synthetase